MSIIAVVAAVAGAYIVQRGFMLYKVNKPLRNNFTTFKHCVRRNGFSGAEDIVPDLTSPGAFYVSVQPRPPGFIETGVPGKITYVKDVTDIDGTKVDLTIDWGGKPKAFSAHGIGLHVENGERYLFAINHALPSRQVVDIFKHDRGTNTLYVLAELGSDSPIRFPFTTTRVNLFFLRTLQQTLESDKFISLNDVHPISKNQCYATNDHGVKSELMQLVTDSAGIPISSVVFHDGQNAEYVSKNFLFANGIAGYGNYIYVAETLTQKVHIFERKANGQLEFQSAKDFDSGVDNIVVDDSNNELSLVVGCHPHIFKFLAHMKGQPKIVPAPSEILRMKLSADGSSFSDENPSVLYYYNGAASSRPDNAISDEIDSIYASSVGAIVNGHLVIGTVNDKDILDCF